MIRKYLITILMAIPALLVPGISPASAAATTFEVMAPTTVAAGERFRVEFTLTNGDAENFVAPTFKGLDVLAGPTISTGTQIFITNNKQETSRSMTYTYFVEASATEAKASISSSSVTSGGKTYSTRALNIDIIPKGSLPGGGGSSGGRSSSRGTTGQGLASDDILLRMDVSRREAYKGDAIVASLTLYTRIGITGLENAKYPAFNGFWAQELDVSGAKAGRATVGNKEYQTQVLRQWLLYPQRTGTLEIEQSEFTALAQIITHEQSGGSLFDQFFGGGPSIQDIRRAVAASPVKIVSKELPGSPPSDFAGAVGKFTMEASVSSNRINANSAGTITLKLKGNGNFPLIEAPRIVMPAAFEQYDTKKSEQLTTTTGGTAGAKTFEYPFIARAEGSYDIPGVTFSYFDPSTRQFVTLTSGDFHIEVLHDDTPGGSSPAMVSGVTKEDLKMLGQDIRFIRVGDPGLVARGRVFLWSPGFLLVFLLIVAAFGGLLLFLKKQIRERADIVKVKNKKANKVALRRLRKAKAHMLAGEETKFFEEMLRALWGYMGDKLAIPVANLTKEKVREELTARGVTPQQSEEFLSLIADCEFAQYSPQAGIQMDKAYSAALDMIGRFENKV